MTTENHITLSKFDSALATKKKLEAAVSDAGDLVRKISGGGNMGLTPDAVKFSDKWQSAYKEMERARKTSQEFNRAFLRIFKKQYKEHLNASR